MSFSPQCHVRAVVAVAFALGGTIAHAADLLSIPSWLPAEPGGSFRYTLRETVKGLKENVVVEIQELAHSASSFALSANVTLIEEFSDGRLNKGEFPLELHYDGDRLRASVAGVVIVFSGVLASPNVGDQIEMSLENPPLPIKASLKVTSVDTTVVKQRRRWEKAVTVSGRMTGAPQGRESDIKGTLSAPEGVIRVSMQSLLNEQLDGGASIVFEVLADGR